MDNFDIAKDYVPYFQMSDYEKAQVDQLVEEYKRGALNTDYTGITHNDVDRFINSRLNLDEMNRINEKLLKDEGTRNKEANRLRYQLFEDRWKKGFYGNDRNVVPPSSAPVNVNINNDSSEVRALKEEVKSLKGDINELKELLKQNLK